MTTIKEQVCHLADTLPENVTWEQVLYEVHVRQQIEVGEEAIREGRTVPHAEVAARFADG